MAHCAITRPPDRSFSLAQRSVSVIIPRQGLKYMCLNLQSLCCGLYIRRASDKISGLVYSKRMCMACTFPNTQGLYTSHMGGISLSVQSSGHTFSVAPFHIAIHMPDSSRHPQALCYTNMLSGPYILAAVASFNTSLPGCLHAGSVEYVRAHGQLLLYRAVALEAALVAVWAATLLGVHLLQLMRHRLGGVRPLVAAVLQDAHVHPHEGVIPYPCCTGTIAQRTCDVGHGLCHGSDDSTAAKSWAMRGSLNS